MTTPGSFDIMKSLSNLESTPSLEERDMPSPIKHTTLSEKKVKKPKNAKKAKKVEVENIKSKTATVENDLYTSISNAGKVNKNPVEPELKKKSKKNKTTRSVSSMSSLSDPSEAESSMDFGSAASSKTSDESNGFGEEDDESNYLERAMLVKKKRKEELLQEKIELLTRITRMSREGGSSVVRKWTLKDDVDDIRFECYRMTRESNSKKAIKRMQHILITIATIIEFTNSWVNPFYLKLDGFSKNLMLTSSDFSDDFEALHHKYSGRSSMGPEMSILFTFASSLVFHHAGNVMNAPAKKEEPVKAGGGMGPLGGLSSMMGMFGMNAKPAPAPNVPSSPRVTEVDSTTEMPKKRRSMKKPGSGGLGDIGVIPTMTVPN